MRSFETRGPVYPEDNYVVARSDELSDFINRLEKGRYVVLFAPRQTGKTTFFHRALETLAADAYFPIQIDFQASNNLEPSEFYQGVYEDIREEIEAVFQRRGISSSAALTEFLDNTEITNHLSMRRFFGRLSNFLAHHHSGQKVVLVIDEFDGIPRSVVSDFLYSLRHIYLSGRHRCPHSVGIVGVKSITQLNYDRSISPFNIQDEFKLPNFTLEQVRELLSQYTDEVGNPLSPRSSNLSTNRRLDNLCSSTGLLKFLLRRWTSRKANRSQWNTFQKHTGSSFANGTRIRSIW